jgi:hypothetical protein
MCSIYNLPWNQTLFNEEAIPAQYPRGKIAVQGKRSGENILRDVYLLNTDRGPVVPGPYL